MRVTQEKPERAVSRHRYVGAATQRSLGLVGALALCLVLAGCGTCAGSNVSAGPVLTVTDHGWLAAHPDASATVCFDRACRKLDRPNGAGPSVVTTEVVGATPVEQSASSYAVTLTIEGAGDADAPRRQTLTVTMTRQSGGGFCMGCGCAKPSSTAQVDLDAAGTLGSTDR